MSPLRILFLASEAEPFVKIGGLGDVAGSLPPAIRELGEELDIRLVIPMHGQVRSRLNGAELITRYTVPHRDGAIPVEVYQTELEELPVYLIAGAPFPPDEAVYTGDNMLDGVKYTYFSLAALDLPRQIGWQPDLIHANDWHTAPAVYALSLRRPVDPFYKHTASLLGVHNLPYLGVGAGPSVQSFGLPPAIQSDLPWWAQDLPLPLGLLAADHIVAVSPCYAEEIITPQFGSGLDEFLARRKGKISGILNGLDTAAWNPATDPAIAAPFDSDTLSTRDLNREHLLAELGFPPTSKAPLLGFIGRMDNQKGVDIAIEALRQNIDTRWHAVILGTGVQSIEEQARKLEAEFPERVRTLIRFDPALSRRIYAGADLLLIPSRYEPCGLAQMIAMRYGCVPVGRATGGLKDTIHDFDQPGLSTGFLFEDETPESLAFTLRRAFHVFADKRRWRALQRRGMSQDFSWRRSAREYVGLYEHLTGKYSNKSV